MLPRMMVAGAFACFAVNGAAQAQVAIGPNSVDAPYVHVDWSHGRVHVVAPFVNLCIRAPAGCQAEAIPLPPPVQTSLRPSASKQIVATGYAQPVARDKAELPSWTQSPQRPISAKSHSAAGAEARDIARAVAEK